MSNGYVSLSLKIPEELNRDLENIKIIERRTKNNLVTVMLETAVKEWRSKQNIEEEIKLKKEMEQLNG